MRASRPRRWTWTTGFRALALLLPLALVGSCGEGGQEGLPSPTATPAATPAAPTPAPTTTQSQPSRLWVLAEADPEARDEPERTRLLRSDDLGASWTTPEGVGLSGHAVALDFATPDRGVAVGAELIQRTEDGGRTWTTQHDDDRDTAAEYLLFEGVTLDGAGDAIALGNVREDFFLAPRDAEIWLAPSDGSPATRVESDGGVFSTVCLTSSGRGILTGYFRGTAAMTAHNTVLVTDDGGGSWRDAGGLGFFRSGTGWHGACAGTADLWLVGETAGGSPSLPPIADPLIEIMRSRDGGDSWEERGSSLSEVVGGLFAAHFVDAQTGWAVGHRTEDGVRTPLVVHTADGGESWQIQTVPGIADGYFSAVEFVDATTGAAGGVRSGGRTPLAAVTSDGGATWVPVALPEGLGWLYDLSIVR